MRTVAVVGTGAPVRQYFRVRQGSEFKSLAGGSLGSQVRITVGKKVITSQVEAGTGQGNQNDRTLHFGLGMHEGPIKIQLHWIDGERQEVDAEPGKLIVIQRAEKK